MRGVNHKSKDQSRSDNQSGYRNGGNIRELVEEEK
jgi:hypothetical protein